MNKLADKSPVINVRRAAVLDRSVEIKPRSNGLDDSKFRARVKSAVIAAWEKWAYCCNWRCGSSMKLVSEEGIDGDEGIFLVSNFFFAMLLGWG